MTSVIPQQRSSTEHLPMVGEIEADTDTFDGIVGMLGSLIDTLPPTASVRQTADALRNRLAENPTDPGTWRDAQTFINGVLSPSEPGPQERSEQPVALTAQQYSSADVVNMERSLHMARLGAHSGDNGRAEDVAVLEHHLAASRQQSQLGEHMLK